MADDPKKHRVDRRLVSSQAHEQNYLKRRLRKLYPARGAAEIDFAIAAARIATSPSESRERIMALCDALLREGGLLRVAPDGEIITR